MTPHEGDQVIGHRPFCDDRFIAAGGEQLGERTPKRERARDNCRLHLTVAPSLERLLHGRAGKSLLAASEIDRPPVVGIDQAEVPVLRPLVEIGHARRRELEQKLREAVHRASRGDPLREGENLRKQIGQLAVAYQADEKGSRRAFVGAIRIAPVTAKLGLAQRLFLPAG